MWQGESQGRSGAWRLCCLLGVSHLFDTHLLSARRPSYKEPTSPVGDNNTIEIGVPYSQEEEMAGRLHAELERMKKHGSSAQLNQTATAA